MAEPRLTFFCELETEELLDLFRHPELSELAKFKAGISLGVIDLSAGRAEVVSRLNEAGVPVVAWLLLPRDQGYWFNLDNATQAVARYRDFKAWTEQYGLSWDGVGLDIEPDIREVEQITSERLLLGWKLLKRVFKRKRLQRAHSIYNTLVEEIRADGYRVDSYQLPIIVDERSMRSTFLQRALGIVDLRVDREVLMLYSSFLRPLGPGVMWSYGTQAQSIAVGSTGGGVELPLQDIPPLDWKELSRDLRLAWVFTDDIHIFSLEGCIRQGFLERLQKFEWDQPIIEPLELAEKVNMRRKGLQSLLWLSARPLVVLLSISGAWLAVVKLRRRSSGG